MSVGTACSPDETGQVAHAWRRVRFQQHDEVLLISCAIKVGASRTEARACVRENLRVALAEWLTIDADSITFVSRPGEAPRVMIDGLPEPGLSISHETGLSLAAVNLHGPIGIDVMSIQKIADWSAVALDYLGPHVTRLLASIHETLRPTAFSRAWCQREALLKLHGQQLAEWTQRPSLPGAVFQLDLPLPMVAALALH